MNRRIVRSQAMRQENFRLIKAALEKKPTVRVSQKGVSPVYAAPLPRNPVVFGSSALFTGGIGDFIAIESFMTIAERAAIRGVYLATRAHGPIRSILEAVPIFPSLETIVVLREDWSDLFCVTHYEHLKDEASRRGWGIDFGSIPSGIVDYSIWYMFNQIKDGLRSYHPSILLSRRLADVSRFNLPDDYALMQPCSPNDRQGGMRDFTGEEWSSTLKHLRAAGRRGVVVLDSTDEYVPDDPMLINLSGRTSIVEAMEIAKGCSEYIGVDSCFAAFATKFLAEDRIAIKTVNPHYIANLQVYCAPKRNFGFIHPNLANKW